MVPRPFQRKKVGVENRAKRWLSAARRADALAGVAEGVVGVGAQARDGGDAQHDNEGKHDGVLDRGRAVFVLQETDQVLRELLHVPNPRSKRNALMLKSGRNPNPAAASPSDDPTEGCFLTSRPTRCRRRCSG